MVTPGGIEGEQSAARAYLPKVNGKPVSGFAEIDAGIMTGLRHATRLAVSFDGKTVEAPKALIAHVFLPHFRTTFTATFRSGMITISSDAQTVVVDLSPGDGSWSGNAAFAFSVDGSCVLGAPTKG